MRIIVDSGCDLTTELLEKHDMSITRVPLSLQLDNKQFIDDESLDIDSYLDIMKSTRGAPKTAAPSPDLYLEECRKDGSSFVITLSSHLSASYSNAMLAKSMYVEEFGHKFIHVFDSLSASVGETLISLKVNEYIKEKLNEREIVQKVNGFIKNMGTFFILENYDILVKSGRINAYIAKLASILSIKPICYGNEGKMALLDKARGYNKAIEKLIDHIAREYKDPENRILGISHVKCLERALAFKEKIAQRLTFKDIVIVEASGLCSTYADRDGIIVAL